MGRRRPTRGRDREKRWGGEGDSSQSRGIAAPRWVAWGAPGASRALWHDQPPAGRASIRCCSSPCSSSCTGGARGRRRHRSPRAHPSSATARRRTRSSSAVREGTSMDWRWADARQQALARAEADAAAGCWAAPELQEQNSGVAVGCQGDPGGQPANPSGCPCAECWRGRVPTKLMPLLMRPVQVDAADVSSVSWAKARMGRQTARLSGLLGSVVCCEGLGPGLGSRAFVPSESTCL